MTLLQTGTDQTMTTTGSAASSQPRQSRTSMNRQERGELVAPRAPESHVEVVGLCAQPLHPAASGGFSGMEP